MQFTEIGRTGGGRTFDGIIVSYFFVLLERQLDIHADRDLYLMVGYSSFLEFSERLGPEINIWDH